MYYQVSIVGEGRVVYHEYGQGRIWNWQIRAGMGL